MFSCCCFVRIECEADWFRFGKVEGTSDGDVLGDKEGTAPIEGVKLVLPVV